MPKNPLGPKPTPPTPVTPVNPGKPTKPTRPTDQGDRAPSLDVAKDTLKAKYKDPDSIPVPDVLPPGFDRMAEVAKANAASGLARAFSGGVPSGWKPVVSDNPEPVTPEPAIEEAIDGE